MARTPQRTKGTDGGLCVSDQPFRGARDLDGAREGNRTLDLRITSALLCRLSYSGERFTVAASPGDEEARSITERLRPMR